MGQNNQNDEISTLSSQLSDENIIFIIKITCVAMAFSFFWPWMLITIDDILLYQAPWATVSGFGFGIYQNLKIYSPTLFLLSIIYYFALFEVWKNTREAPDWNHLKPPFMIFAVFVFQLLSKRQQAMIIVSPSATYYRPAQAGSIPHVGLGLLIFFFSIMILMGFHIIRAHSQPSQSLKMDFRSQEMCFLGVFLFILPMYFAFDGMQMEVLLGFGYGWIWDSTGITNGLAFGGCLINLFQVFLLLVIAANVNDPKMRKLFEEILIVVAGGVFATSGYVNWIVYVPEGQLFSIYPPMSIFQVVLFWVYAYLAWDAIAIRTIINENDAQNEKISQNASISEKKRNSNKTNRYIMNSFSHEEKTANNTPIITKTHPSPLASDNLPNDIIKHSGQKRKVAR
jgi:hypothetical protein